MTNESSTPGEIRSSDQLGLAPERAAFEEWLVTQGWIEAPAQRENGTYVNGQAQARWLAWVACWPLARAAIYGAEQAQIEAPLRAEIERLRASLQRIVHFTSATPSLSESGCGRLLAQIEHEAMKALKA